MGASQVLCGHDRATGGDELLGLAQLGIGTGLGHMVAHCPYNGLKLLDVALALETRRHRGTQIVEDSDRSVQLAQLDLHGRLCITEAGGGRLTLILEQTEQDQRCRSLQRTRPAEQNRNKSGRSACFMEQLKQGTQVGEKPQRDDQLILAADVQKRHGIVECLNIRHMTVIGDIPAGIEYGGGRGNGAIVDVLPDAVQLQKAGALNNGLLRDGGKLLPYKIDKERICLRVDGMDDAGGYGILDLSLGILQLVGSQGNVRGNGTADDPQYILEGRLGRDVFTDHQAAFRCEYTEVREPEQAIFAVNKEASLFRTVDDHADPTGQVSVVGRVGIGRPFLLGGR